MRLHLNFNNVKTLIEVYSAADIHSKIEEEFNVDFKDSALCLAYFNNDIDDWLAVTQKSLNFSADKTKLQMYYKGKFSILPFTIYNYSVLITTVPLGGHEQEAFKS